MDNPINKFVDGLKKQAIKLAISEAECEKKLTPKEQKLITENLSSGFTVSAWLENNFSSRNLAKLNTFVPAQKNEILFDFLALDVGYKRTVKQAFDDNFPFVRELLGEVDDHLLAKCAENIKQLNADLIPLYIFFAEEIKQAPSEGLAPIVRVREKINVLSKKAKEGTKVSHGSKFTNPEVKFPRIYAEAGFASDGFVRTGNVEVEFDMHINAASLQVYKFLSLEIAGYPLLDLFAADRFSIFADTFGVEKEEYNTWKQSFCSCLEGKQQTTDRLLKQVYFPVGDTYHQLSLVFPSSLSFKMKEKIDDMNSLSKESYTGKKRKKKDEFYDKPFSSIFDLTLQRYGGDHPKNISALNNKHQNVYLLASAPPQLADRKVQPPRNDFFRNSLWLNNFKDDFQKFHALLEQDRNNIHIRQKRDWLIRSIIYQVADRMWMIRSLEPGWSGSDNYQQLPGYQKIWLDQIHKEQRDDVSNWFAAVQKELALWFIRSYRELLGRSALSLADDELPHIKKMIAQCEEALR